jgi:hypothetical protein
VEDDDVLARFEHEIEVTPPQRLFRPPAIGDEPLLPNRRHADTADRHRHALRRLDANGTWLVQSSRGTRIALVSGMRDHGATSTTVQTASIPAAARTWRNPSRRRLRSRLPRGRTFKEWVAVPHAHGDRGPELADQALSNPS